MSVELAISQNNDLNNNLNNSLNNSLGNNLKNLQENFLKSSIGSAINNAINIGLKSILPDLIEDEIINIKDTILENGFAKGLEETVKTAIDFGKSALGIVTGKFENVNQIDIAVRKGGIIDTVSDCLDTAVEKANKKGLIDNTISSLIKKGKNAILSTVSSEIENTIEDQTKAVQKLEKYCNNWNEAFKEQDLQKMQSAYKNVEKYLKTTVPLENTIKEARRVENLHNLIKSKENDFNLTEEELKLAEKLN